MRRFLSLSLAMAVLTSCQHPVARDYGGRVDVIATHAVPDGSVAFVRADAELRNLSERAAAPVLRIYRLNAEEWRLLRSGDEWRGEQLCHQRQNVSSGAVVEYSLSCTDRPGEPAAGYVLGLTTGSQALRYTVRGAVVRTGAR